tara:strand:- start:2350 stop:2547 length:198 start_codon:yes stop_codon:yes gene_type:complete
MKSIKSFIILSSVGASTTILLVIPVIPSIISGIGMPGLIKVVYLSDAVPSLKRIAATSITLSVST